MFASLSPPVPVPVPFDLPHPVTVRKLPGKELDAAQAANMKNAASGILGRDWHARVQRQMRKGIDEIRLKQLSSEQLAARETDAVLVELDDPMNFSAPPHLSCVTSGWRSTPGCRDRSSDYAPAAKKQ